MTPLRWETDEAPITLACEPLGVPGGSGARVKLSMRMKAGTTPEEARAIAGVTREGGDVRPLGQGVVPVIASDVAAVVLGWGGRRSAPSARWRPRPSNGPPAIAQ